MSAMTAAGPVVTRPALRRVPLPVSEPKPALRLVRETGARSAAARDHETPVLPLGAPELRVVATDAGPAAGGDAPAPELRRWVAQFVQAAVEVSLGVRPSAQLVRWTSEEVYAALARRATLADRQAGRPLGLVRVTSVHATSPAEGVVEACAVVGDGRRIRAVALRLEAVERRWIVTVLRLG